MDKKTIITSMVISVFLIGIVSATIIPYFGKIVGSVSVSAPVFYLSHGHTSINNHADYSLIPSNSIETGSTSFTGDGHNSVFVTGPLNLNYIYPANYKIFINVCAENKTVNSSTGELDFTLRVLHSNGISESPSFCEVQKLNVSTVNSCSSGDYNIYSVNCAYGKLNLNSSDSLKLIISDMGSHEITYHIKMDGDSRIEVIPQ